MSLSENDENSQLVRGLYKPDQGGAAPPELPASMANGQFNGKQTMDELAIGKEIALILEDEKYHPVIVFGTIGAGKTTLLASLLAGNYATGEATSFDVSLADHALFPTGHPQVAKIRNEAVEFFEGRVRNHVDGQLQASTRFEYPFYIPIELTPTNAQLDPARFAFLECQGEFFNPQLVTSLNDARSYLLRKELPGFIAGVLLHYTKPMSLIHVAPCALNGRTLEQQRNADLALLHGLANYQQRRDPSGLSREDNHLFLLSMWDEHTNGIAAESFVRPDVSHIEEILVTRFKESWGKFKAMRTGRPGRSHTFMQYSAGPVSGDGIARVPHEAHRILNRYPRTVLNWLYGNAKGHVLFPDVLEQPPSRKTLLDHVLQFAGLRL